MRYSAFYRMRGITVPCDAPVFVLGTPRATTAVCPCRTGHVHTCADRWVINAERCSPSCSWGRSYANWIDAGAVAIRAVLTVCPGAVG